LEGGVPGEVGAGAGTGVGAAIGGVGGDGAGVGTWAMMLVVMLVEHVTTVPPGLPVPLHWLTATGIAGLTAESEATSQSTVPPPPLPEPLHCVTVASVVVAGKGEQSTVPPPPVPEPAHWLTVAGVTDSAPGVPALMLFVMVTTHLIGCAASLPDPLHWLTAVTRSVELVTNVPFPGAQGSREHCRVMVTVELVESPLMVLTTVTMQVIRVVAPPGPGPTSLHWSTATFAAWAAGGGTANTATDKARVSTTSGIATTRDAPARPDPRVGRVVVVMDGASRLVDSSPAEGA
jgi:hypothetical protein